MMQVTPVMQVTQCYTVPESDFCIAQKSFYLPKITKNGLLRISVSWSVYLYQDWNTYLDLDAHPIV